MANPKANLTHRFGVSSKTVAKGIMGSGSATTTPPASGAAPRSKDHLWSCRVDEVPESEEPNGVVPYWQWGCQFQKLQPVVQGAVHGSIHTYP